MIEIIKIAKSYGKKKIIESATLSVPAGRILVLTGPSGIGKSTLMEIMAGLISPDHGLVKRKAKVSFMFQDNALIPWLTALANLSYILPNEKTETQKNELASYWLNRFALELKTFPAAMSGGMRRRLSLARTFAAERPVVLLDEPLAFLDKPWHKTVIEIILEQLAKNTAIVVAGHSLPHLLAEAAGYRLDEITLEKSPILIPAASKLTPENQARETIIY